MERPFNFFLGNILWMISLTEIMQNEHITIAYLLLIVALFNVWIGILG